MALLSVWLTGRGSEQVTPQPEPSRPLPVRLSAFLNHADGDPQGLRLDLTLSNASTTSLSVDRLNTEVSGLTLLGAEPEVIQPSDSPASLGRLTPISGQTISVLFGVEDCFAATAALQAGISVTVSGTPAGQGAAEEFTLAASPGMGDWLSDVHCTVPQPGPSWPGALEPVLNSVDPAQPIGHQMTYSVPHGAPEVIVSTLCVGPPEGSVQVSITASGVGTTTVQ